MTIQEYRKEADAISRRQWALHGPVWNAYLKSNRDIESLRRDLRTGTIQYEAEWAALRIAFYGEELSEESVSLAPNRRKD